MRTSRPRAKQGPRFIHERILADIQGKILSGRWAAGCRIPIEQELMKQYQCSRMTVSKVLTRLAHAGLIVRRRKAGSFVGHPHSQSAVLDIPDIKVEVAALDLPYSYGVLHRHKRRSSREEREIFGKDGAVPMLELDCLHMAGEQPFCLEQRLINLQAVPEAASETFAELAPGAWLRRRVPWMLAEHRIRAAAAEPEAAAALKIKPRTPCLVIERTTRDVASAITFVRLIYPGNLHELVASFMPIAAVSDADLRDRSPASRARSG